MESRDDQTPAATLRRLIIGFQVSQAIHVAATLGIADRLADRERSADELASESGAHPDALYRLLRALAAAGVLHECEGRRFSLTPVGACLRRDAPDSLAGWAAFVGRPYVAAGWSHLLHAVQTEGSPASCRTSTCS
jgi:hypothetical protein